MPGEQWAEIKAQFLRVQGLLPAEREAELAALRTSQPELAATLERMLRADATTDSLPPFGNAGTQIPDRPIPVIPGYQIVGEIGRGGMGIVYEAMEQMPRRAVAMKVLQRHVLSTPRDVERFHREANSVAGMNHPNVVKVFAVDAVGEDHFFTMELVPGRNLGEILMALRVSRAEESLPPPEMPAWGARGYERAAAEIAAAVADALDAAHAGKVVHRDVKPSNLLVTKKRQVKLVDFGIARDETQGQFTRTQETFGTPDYMSPEQVRAEKNKVDHRTDVYSLGVVLYEILTLLKPYEGTGRFELPARILSPEQPPKVRTLNPRVPADLQTIVEGAMDKEAATRYATAAEMRDDLQRFLSHEAIHRKSPNALAVACSWARRRRKHMAGAAGILALVAALVFAGLYMSARRERLAWLKVDGIGNVVRQRVDDSTLDLSTTVTPMGSGRLKPVGLGPGHYRVTVIERDGRFTEFDVWMPEAGVRNRTALVVRDGREGWIGAPSGGINPGERTLQGRPATAAEVMDGMVLIPAGAYAVGTAEYANPILKIRTVELPAFYIDLAETSNGEYWEYVQATGALLPRHWSGRNFGIEMPDGPVTGITMEEAAEYARWRGKRLPTMFEWQAATRGSEGRRYPWGDELDAEGMTMEPTHEARLFGESRDATGVEEYAKMSVGVRGGDPRATVNGIIHSFGNVRELTSSISREKRAAVAMGRCWSDSVRTPTLGSVWEAPLRTQSVSHGFRCAKSAVAVPHGGS